MNDEQMSNEIARRCGWRFDGYHWKGRRGGVEQLGTTIYPDFTDSLDQMARAERTLTHPKRRARYIDALNKVMGGGVWGTVTADARTRALAFLEATKGRPQ